MSEERNRRLQHMLEELSEIPCPSGYEARVRDWVLRRLPEGLSCRVDPAGNVVVRVRGRRETITAVCAHLDEVGMIVKRLDPDGRIRVTNVGGIVPWIWGECPVVIEGLRETLQGVLSFGSAHVSSESPHSAILRGEAAVRWEDTWIETCVSRDALGAAGIGPGSRVIRMPRDGKLLRFGENDDYVAMYGIDDKAGIVALLEILAKVKQPLDTIDVVFTVREELLGQGILFYANEIRPETVIALEIMPVAREYGVQLGPHPVLTTADFTGPLDGDLVADLLLAASRCGINMQTMLWSTGGSDASKATQMGAAGRSACIGWATQNTHGFEITSLTAIGNCIDVIVEWLDRSDLKLGP